MASAHSSLPVARRNRSQRVPSGDGVARTSHPTWAAAACCASLLMLGACGDGSPREVRGAPQPTFLYGSDAAAEASPITDGSPGTAGSVPTATSTPSTTAPTAAPSSVPVELGRPVGGLPDDLPRIANGTVRDDPSGFRLTLAIEKLVVGRTDDVLLELRFENRSPETKYIFSDQARFFLIADSAQNVRWQNDLYACVDPPQPPLAFGVPLESGDANRFLRRYPAERSNTRRERCRIEPGEYVIYAFLEWCPRATRENRGCSGDQVEVVQATPMNITVTP